MQPFYEIDESGIAIRSAAPAKPHELKNAQAIQAVQTRVHRDLTLEMRGPHFSAKTQLSVDQAMGLAMMLLYACREHPGVRQLPKGGAQ